MNLIIFFLLVYGICNIIVFANGPFHIFVKMHEYFKMHHPMLEEVSSCMICLPTWVGMFLSAVNIIFFPYIPFTPMNMVLLYAQNLWPIAILFDGLIASGGNWLIHTCQERIENNKE